MSAIEKAQPPHMCHSHRIKCVVDNIAYIYSYGKHSTSISSAIIIISDIWFLIFLDDNQTRPDKI